MSNPDSDDCLCGCCAGASVQTPQGTYNLPGLRAVSRRVGTWATFKQSFLARLSSSDYPALAALKTRADDDFTVALLDASAMVLDILTFYQERLNNECYLRTAGQARSQTELARLIGYRPSPGVAASAYLAFTLKAAPGLAANPATAAITIPAGTQVQSVPAQGQIPQTFETLADIQAKADWNAMAVQTTQAWVPQRGDTFLYLDGLTTQLNPGDAILVVGNERLNNGFANNNWDVRTVLSVTPDPALRRTRITWSKGLGAPEVLPAQDAPKVYALRQRAALFGYNAIDPNLLNVRGTAINGELVPITTGDPSAPTTTYVWGNLQMNGTIDLDAVYPKIVPGGWAVLADLPDGSSDPGLPASNGVELYQVVAASTVPRSAFGLSAKISRIIPDDTSLLDKYDLRRTLALAQSEELAVADQPLAYPLYGNVIDLADLRPDLNNVSVVAISGTRQKINITAAGLSFAPDDSTQPGTALSPGDVLTLIQPAALPAPPWDATTASTTISALRVEDASGRTGTVQGVSLGQFSLKPSAARDPVVSEYALVSFAGPAALPRAHTRVQLASPLANCYDRATATVNANVGLATQGRTVSEILGGGSASTPNQSFVLKQSPLTFVPASTPGGSQSTLQVRVNAVAWSETPSLYGQASGSQVFATLNQADGTTKVIFGDGVEGAVLPTGQNNLQATYRVGSGAAGNVGGGTLTTLMDRPLGVSGVTNPQPATGGQDAQGTDDIRASAPLTVLTLGRAVSITDYQNYASTFAGISKAHAIWIPNGPGRGVFLTVAGVAGAVLPTGNPTLAALFTSLQSYGNPLVPITVASYVETLFRFSADLRCDPAYVRDDVQARAWQAVAQAFGFTARSFGEGVSADEMAAVIQAVPGVVAVNVTAITRTTSSSGGDITQEGRLTNAWLAALTSLPRLFADTPTQLYASLPVASALSPPCPAEILVLDPNPSASTWGVMS